MNLPLLLLVSLLSGIANVDLPSNLSSNRASYNGKDLILEGAVTFEHDLGICNAEKVRFDLDKKLLHMEQPVGTVASLFFPDHPERRCHFQAQTLIWDHPKEQLDLEGNIDVQDEYLGTLTGEDKVSIFQTQRFGKYVIQAIEATGTTFLESQESKLLSHGFLKLDRDNLLLVITSPSVDGITPLNKQLMYQNGDIILYADEATVEYALQGLALKPVIAHLKGHVRMQGKSGCGISDQVHYHPDTSQIQLQAETGRQVLFWHHEQNRRLSAREISILIDKETKEETVKGIGTVRFTFNEEENALQKELFPPCQDH